MYYPKPGRGGQATPLVAVYNWINYNQADGYSIWCGDDACTATNWSERAGSFQLS